MSTIALHTFEESITYRALHGSSIGNTGGIGKTERAAMRTGSAVFRDMLISHVAIIAVIRMSQDSWHRENGIVIHSSDMSIIQKFLTNQIASNEIIIVMTPYCPTPQHLLHNQERVNLLILMTFDESKCPGYLNFL